MEEFQRIALANPDKSFSFFQNELEVYQLKPGKLSKRIINLFGKNHQEQLVPCEEEMDDMKLTGYIGKPEFSRKSRGEQFLFVNNRFVRNNYLNHAVITAFADLIPEGNYPFYVLFLQIEPKHIDVNVHPTKTEIKFDDERSVYTLVKLAVRKALGSHHITPSLDFTVDANFMINTSGKDHESRKADHDYAKFSNIPDLEKNRAKDWEKLFDDALTTETMRAQALRQNPEIGGESTMRLESAVNKMEGREQIIGEADSARQIFQLYHGYIVARVKSGLMLIDQRAAHERILFEKYLEILQGKKGSSQQSLFPEQIKLNPSDYSLVKELEGELKHLGFSFEQFGENTLAISGVPVDAPNQSGGKVFMAILDDFKKHQHEFREKKSEYMAKVFARYSSIESERKLAFEEMTSLIDQLFACNNPNHSPDGQLIYYILKAEEIHNIFNKKTNVQ
jgi:DNA mismatch repair protein MutL